MSSRSRNQTKHPTSLWTRVIVHARQKLYRLNRHGQKKDDTESSPRSKKQLGRFADEDQMPSWLRQYLASRDDNIDDGIIQILSETLKLSCETKSVYLVHPCVSRITKLRREGSFCGYRNIQMLISHLVLATKIGARVFPAGVPNIFQLQDQIEEAWDHGYNSRGRSETGGIRGTRKFIGTQEAQALFLNLNIKCKARKFQDTKECSAVDQLVDDIESYFQHSCSSLEDCSPKIRNTMLPPIYFQRPGHSLTVVGLETTINNDHHLLVFNPARRYKEQHHTLEPYRLRLDSLREYSEFELLYLAVQAED